MAIKYENWDGGDTGQVLRPYAELFNAAQTFTPLIGHSLTQVVMRLRKRNTPPATYRVQIQETTLFLPNGIVLAQAEFASAPITALAGGEMKVVVLDAPCIVGVGVKYAKVLTPVINGDFNNTLQWYYKTDTNPYPRGSACARTGTEFWGQLVDADTCFEEWGDPAALPIVTTNPATEVT